MQQELVEERKILFVVYVGNVCLYMKTYDLSKEESITDDVILFQVEGTLNIDDERGVRAFTEEMREKVRQ